MQKLSSGKATFMALPSLNQWHPFWDLLTFEQRRHHPRAVNGSAAGGAERRYPVRLLRYWFMDHLLRQEAGALRRPIDVCEVGIGCGHLLDFVTSVPDVSQGALPSWVNRWDGVSKGLDRSKVAPFGYSNCYEADIEKSLPDMAAQYDAVILLHILEHLNSPEAAIARLLPYVRPGGLILGGCPTLPDLLRPMRERQLRRRAEPFGHVSVISAERMKRMAREHRLDIELLTGSYLVRATGSKIEDSRMWLRFNLIISALMTGWVGEIYWALRKPAAA